MLTLLSSVLLLGILFCIVQEFGLCFCVGIRYDILIRCNHYCTVLCKLLNFTVCKEIETILPALIKTVESYKF